MGKLSRTQIVEYWQMRLSKRIRQRVLSAYRRWTPEEDVFLSKFYARSENKDLSRLFNRELRKVYRRAARLGLTKDRDFRNEQISEHRRKYFQKTPGALLGKNNGRWKGGLLARRNGYILVKMYSHPYAGEDYYYPQHRSVVEAVIGRYLLPEEVVHHINSVKHDNRRENLYIFDSNIEHMRYHKNAEYGNCLPITSSNLHLYGETITHERVAI